MLSFILTMPFPFRGTYNSVDLIHTRLNNVNVLCVDIATCKHASYLLSPEHYRPVIVVVPLDLPMVTQCYAVSQMNSSACMSSCRLPQDLGVFIPAGMAQGMRMELFMEGSFMPNRMKLDRETPGGLADMFGQMPGRLCVCVCFSLKA